jgi:hypothetical protein
VKTVALGARTRQFMTAFMKPLRWGSAVHACLHEKLAASTEAGELSLSAEEAKLLHEYIRLVDESLNFMLTGQTKEKA